MGRKGLIGLAGKAQDKARRKKTAVGLATGAAGRSPAEAFLSQFTGRLRQEQQKRDERQEQARAIIKDRLGAAGGMRGRGRGSMFSRLFFG